MSAPFPLDFTSLVLRFAVGGAMLPHGWAKVKGGWGRQSGEWIKGMGIPPIFARLVTLLEFFGPMFLIIGLLVPIVAALFIVQFAAIMVMKASKMQAGFMAAGGKPGYEIDFTYLLLALAILLIGAGTYSLDAIIGVV
ncbi:MAG TPA: DoxX family protein [Nitrososphaerales archaeon]|nr:DoxX family protein [Nitrososphaerales archaeon]